MIKMIVAFVLTFYWPHIKSPPRENFTTLGAPLAQQQTNLLTSRNVRGNLSLGPYTCSGRALGPSCGPSGCPFHSFTPVATAHTQRRGRFRTCSKADL